MNLINRVKLLNPRYQAPCLRVGDRATCALRGEVVITRLSNGRIRWPRCRALAATRGGGSGLLLAGDLARAVRQESATAIRFWFGVGRGTVARWRAALGVTNTNNPGTRRLVRHAAALGGEAVHARGPAEQRRPAKPPAAEQRDLARNLTVAYEGPWRRAAELQPLSKLPTV